MALKQFYVVKRKDRLTDGKPTYYVRLRDESGELKAWRSTGETAKTRAENWALRRINKKNENEHLTFTQFAAGWFTDDHPFVKGREARGSALSPNYLEAQRLYLKKHILPVFGRKLVSQIKPSQVENWLLSFSNPASANRYLSCLKVMLGEARRLGVISANPAKEISKLAEKPKEKTILTKTEVHDLFADPDKWRDLKHYTANLLSASKGLRLGEVQGLQTQYVFEDYVAVMHSWGRGHGLQPPKGGIARDVPIPTKTSEYLQKVIEPETDAESFVFCGVAPFTPIDHKTMAQGLYDALAAFEIDEDKRRERNITFHSWRHFFNTLCRNRIPDYKLRLLTGHRTEAMTEHYTHVSLADFGDVAKLQEEVFA
jgi:integrase